MILTCKLRHQFDLSNDLAKAHQVAEFAIANRNKLSSKEVSHIGLKSAISNQILRKYGKNKRCKSVKKVNLIVPSQAIQVKNKTLKIVPLGLCLDIRNLPAFTKVNQVELSKEFAFVSVEVAEALVFSPTGYVGCDRNAVSHIAVLANPSTGKVLKLGKSCSHLRNKYRAIRASAQEQGAYRFVKKQLGRRETNIMRDINHKIAKEIIQYCLENKVGLVLEDLKGIRKQKSKGRKLNGIVNSWSFYQLESFLVYKALRYGAPIFKIDPHYTSQQCSRCGAIGIRDGKSFSCQKCEHTDHADVNAAFNIAQRQMFGQSSIDRDIDESLPIFPDYEKMNTDKARSGNVQRVS